MKPGRAERKNRRLSSQNRKDRRTKESRSGRGKPGREAKAEKKGSTGGTAVGAKPGRMKGNKQEAEYENLERKHGKPGGGESFILHLAGFVLG